MDSRRVQEINRKLAFDLHQSATSRFLRNRDREPDPLRFNERLGLSRHVGEQHRKRKGRFLPV